MNGCALGFGSCRGLFAAERTLLEALDFCQHILGLGFHFKICQVAVRIVVDAHFVFYSIEHVQHSCQLIFGAQTDVQSEVSAMLAFFAQAVLADEHKCGQEIASRDTTMVKSP